MLSRLALFALLAGLVGCSKPTDTKPEATPTPTPAADPNQIPAPHEPQPKKDQTGGADRAAEDRAVEYLKKVGGRYRFDDYGEGNHLSHIYLMGAKATDEGIRDCLLPSLHYIDFGETPLTDDTLKLVGKLPHLSNLHVGSPKVTDAGVAHLTGAKNLISIYLDGCTEVTVDGVKKLAALPELIDLVVKDTKVTDDGVKELKKLMPKCLIMR